MTDSAKRAKKVDDLAHKLSGVVHGFRRGERSPLVFDGSSVRGLMVMTERRNDITPKLREQIDDLVRRIEILEGRRPKSLPRCAPPDTPETGDKSNGGTQ
jgi:hypothetical protein